MNFRLFTPEATIGSQPVLFLLLLAVLMCMIPCMTKLTVQVERDFFADNYSQINMMQVQKQQGTDDCGLFSIAFAVL